MNHSLVTITVVAKIFPSVVTVVVLPLEFCELALTDLSRQSDSVNLEPRLSTDDFIGTNNIQSHPQTY